MNLQWSRSLISCLDGGALFRLVLILFLFGALTPSSSFATDEHATDEQRSPNIVVFLVDDLGQMDIGANNPNCFYETPNIDGFAKTAMRFTDGYAANPVCSPTRYSLMTGKYPSRVDATNFFSGKRGGRFRPAPLNDFMPLDEITIAQLLKDQGYATFFACLLYTSPSPRDATLSRMPSSA